MSANAKSINLKTYTYHGTDKRGNKTTGECKAKTKKAATLQLTNSGIKVIRITKKSAGIFSKSSIKDKDIVHFTRYLATLIRAGIPIVQSLDVCVNSSENPALAEVLNRIKTSVQSGHSFSESLGLYPKYFNSFYRNLLRIGESSGKLDTMLCRIADYLENMHGLRDKMKKALMYPSIIILVSIGVSVVLLIYVVPQFESMFANLNAELPWFTQKVLNISRWLQAYWYKVLATLIIGFYMLKNYFKHSTSAKAVLDKVFLNLPIFGSILEKVCLARYARTLSTMLSSGIPLLNCLPAASNIVGNSVYSKAIDNVKLQVQNGQALHKAMQSTEVFNHMVIQMTAIGESTGTLDEMLTRISDLYESEVDSTVSNLSDILEPIVIVIISAIVGSLIVAMYLPIFSLGSVL